LYRLSRDVPPPEPHDERDSDPRSRNRPNDKPVEDLHHSKPRDSRKLSVALLEYKYRVSTLAQQIDNKLAVYPNDLVARHVAAQFLPQIASLRSKLRNLEKRANEQPGDRGSQFRAEIARLNDTLDKREALLSEM